MEPRSSPERSVCPVCRADAFPHEHPLTDTPHTALRVAQAKFDWGGTFLQIASIALTVYGLTSANYKGWYVLAPSGPAMVRRFRETDSAFSVSLWPSRKKAETLAPLLIGLALFPAFFAWEARMDQIDALVSALADPPCDGLS